MTVMLSAETMAQERLAFASCPLCRATDATMTYDALGKGGDWQCARCSQKWSATRLATVTTYAAWVAERTTRRRETHEQHSSRPTHG
jgi:hypothetical protein